MSGRSLDSASVGSGRKGRQGQPGVADAQSAEDFEKMRREVDLLGELSMPLKHALQHQTGSAYLKHACAHAAGASELDKRQRKEFEAKMLKGMKAKAEKGPRMPASIGLGAAIFARFSGIS